MSNTIAIRVVADARAASRNLRGVGDDVDRVGQRSGRARSAVAGFAGGMAASFGASTIKAAAKSAGEHELALKKLAQANAANNGISGITVDALKAQAAATETLTGAKLDEDDIITGQQTLLRAGIAGRANYDKAVLASANLAVGTNTNAAASAKVLAKALAFPEKAAATLKKSGIQLSVAQQAQIKAFQAAGNAAGAQGVVLDAVGAKYNGVAKLAGETTAGKLGILQDTFEDTARDLVARLIPAATQILGVLAKFAPVILPIVAGMVALFIITKAVAAAQAAATAITTIYTAVTNAGGIATKVAAAGQWLMNAALTANPIGLVILAIVAFVAAIVIAYKKSATFRAIVQAAFAGVKKGIDILVKVVKGIGGFFATAFKFAQDAIGKFVDFFTTAYDKIVGFFTGLKDSAADIGGSIFRGIIGGIAKAYNALPSIVKKGISKIPGLGGIGDALNNIANAAPAPTAASSGGVTQINNYNVRTVPTEREQRLAAIKAQNLNGRTA